MYIWNLTFTPKLIVFFPFRDLSDEKNVRLAKSWEIWWDLASHQSHTAHREKCDVICAKCEIANERQFLTVRRVRSPPMTNVPTCKNSKPASLPEPQMRILWGVAPTFFHKYVENLQEKAKKGGKKPFWKNRFTFLAGTSTILIGWIWKSGDVRKSGEGSDVTCVTRDKLDIICLTVRTLVRKSVRNGEMSIPTNFPHTDRWESAHKEILTSLSSVR